jgi:hypothetical protein
MTYKKGWLEQDSGLQYNRNSQTLEANKLKAGSGVSIGNISNDPVLVDSTATLKTEFAIGTNVDRVDEKIDVQNEPTGITPEQRAVTTIDFDSTARTFTIAPTGGSFQYWDQGVKYIKYGPQSVQFPDVEGLHFFFFEGPSLGTISSFDESLLLTKTYLAVLYWDADNQEVIYFGDERHTPQMPGRTHLSLHLGIGTVYISGLALTGIVADASGALDSHAQFGFSSGIILDEDLQIDITSDPTPSLTKIYYKEGAAGNWRCDCPVNFPVKNFGAGRVAYNMMSGGTWQQFQADEGAYTLSHIFATNDTCCKLIVVQGQSQYTSLANAREAANEEILNIATEGLPFEEFVSVGTIIFQTSNSYGNSVKARAITTATGSTYVDFRGTRSTGAITTAVTQHNTLGGREDPSSHPAEAISYEDGTTQTTVQLKMEELDSSIGTHPVTAAGTDNASWSVNQDASALGTKFTSSAGVLNIQRQDGADINIEHDGRFKSDSYQLDTQSVTLAGDTLTASGAQAFILVRGEGFNDDDLDRIVLSGIPERTPIYLYGQGTETITIKHDNYVGNGKIITPTGEDVILGPGDTVQLIENSTGTQYNVIGISQAVSASEVTVDNSQFINFLIDSTSNDVQGTLEFIDLNVVFTEDIDSNIIGGTGAGGNLVGGSGLNNFLGGVSAGSELTTGDENVIIGNAAVQYNQTGSYNVVIGRYAGRGVSANSYSNNIIVGFQSGYLLTTGGNNVLVGYQAGYSNTTQSDLIAIGYQAGYNSTGITNMFIGTQAGFSTVSGQRNTIIGYLAGYRNTGSQNTILGREAGYNQQSGLNNVFLGVNAGAGVGAYSASQNTFVGHSAGSGCTANNNVFVGYLAGQNAGAGGGNTGVGYRAAIASGTGSYFGCTAVGYDCCSGLTSGSRNTAMGYDAFGALQTGEYNVGVGYQVGRANVTSGSYNTLIGYEAGYNMAAASSYNVFLGYQAGYSETGSNKLHIANNSTESLIEGDFSARTVKINGDLTVETLYADASSVVIGTTVLSEKSGGGILINDQEIEVISGIHTLPSGDSTSSIIFETPMENSNYAISASTSNEVDETPSIYSFIITNKSTTGFNVLLSGNLDSGNYKLEYMVKKDPYIS